MSLTDNDGPPVPSTPSQSADAPPLSPSEIDTLLTVSLHHVLSTLQPSSFPMPASLLYSAHVLPCRPAYIPISQRDDVVIGKSEWKKLSKWMKEASKEGLLKIKETKGEVIVTG
jgi:translation initiation factor 2D